MAGKTKRQGHRHRTPSSPKPVIEVPKGHLGLKSSPFAPIDCDLTSQYMVIDHMVAHYRKINSAKSTIDNGTPKAWLVSQKVRDQARRHALQHEVKQHNNCVKPTRDISRAPSQASSDVARDEMLAMMESLDNYDDVDAHPNKAAAQLSNTTLEVHASDDGPDGDEMALINKIIADQQNSPSKYHNPNSVAYNIPKTSHKRPSSAQKTERQHSARSQHGGSQTPGRLNVTRTLRHPHTARSPKSSDVLESQPHKFTEERPFQPRINKATRPSKLADFKCYNGPRNMNKTRPATGESGLKSSTRPVTPLTESVDLMNASLMSRDLTQMRTPTGVPPLDISLDGDHMRWLKEQSKKAELRSTYKAGGQTDRLVPGETQTSGQPGVTERITTATGEEELKYLEFITEVTNDVLERGIFTNRVLKQVFHSHIQRRQCDLKVSRMRELLDELRKDLGIPNSDEDSDEGFGLASTLTKPGQDPQSKSLKFVDLNDNVSSMSLEDDHPARKRNSSTSARSNVGGLLNGTVTAPFDPLLMTTKKFDMATLRQASRSASQDRARSPSPGTGRPPVPKVNPRSTALRTRGSMSRESSYEEEDIGSANPSHTGPDGMHSLKVSSKPDDDLSAYSQNVPISSQTISPTREIGPIEEVRETARTEPDTSRSDTVTVHTEHTETARSETDTTCSDTSTARSGRVTGHTETDQARGKEETARSERDSVFNQEETARETSRSGTKSVHSKADSDTDTARSYAANIAEYENDYEEEEPETQRSSPPKPTPRKRTSKTSTANSRGHSTSPKSSPARSVHDHGSDSVILSEIEEDF